jgi:hypothetical protein
MAKNTSWIGGLINTLFSVGSSYESGKVAKAWRNSANANTGTVMDLGQQMMDNATKDWEHFKTTFQPVEQAMATRAARDPNTAMAEGNVAGSVASGMSEGSGQVLRRGINPNSGNTAANLRALTVAGGRAGGFGMGRARREEEDRVFNERAGVSAGARGIQGESAIITGRNIDTLQQTSKRAAGVADAYSGSSADALYGVGKGIGQMGYGFNFNKPAAQTREPLQYGQEDKGNQANQNAGGEYWYADGGMVRGPGTGRSDSVPATIDGDHPARLSNGEFVIPSRAVAMIGKDKLDALVAKYHRPVIEGRATRVE